MSGSGNRVVRVGRSRYSRILLLCILSFLANALDRGNISVAAPEIARAMGLTAVLIGVVFSAFQWGYVPMQIPGGLAGQRFSPKKVVLTCMLLWSAATLLTAFVQSVEQLVAARVLLGFAEGAAFPTYIYLLSRWFPRQERGQANSLLFSAGIFGSFLGSPITGFLIAISGWRTMFALEAVPPLVVAAAFAYFVGDDPRTDTRISSSERDWIVTRLEAERIEVEAARTSAVHQVRWHDVLRNPRLWAASILYGAPGFAAYGGSLFLPTVISELTNIGIGFVGVLAAIPTFLGVILLTLNGRLSDQFKRRDLFAVWPSVIAGLGLLVGYSLDDVFVKLIVILLAVGAANAAAGVAYAFSLDVTPVAHRGMTSGFTNMFAQTAGLIAPLAVGFIAGTGPASSAIWILGVVPLLGASIACILLVVTHARQAATRVVAQVA